jgi:transcriptional regulator with XRE-family HTH domain
MAIYHYETICQRKNITLGYFFIMLDKFRIRQMAIRKGLGLTLKELAARAKTSYKTAVSWESKESPRRKDPDILLNICNVFREELVKQFPGFDFQQAEVKKYLENGVGDLGPAGQLLFEQPASYGQTPGTSPAGESQKMDSLKSEEMLPSQLMEGVGMNIGGDIVQDIMKSGTPAQKERLKKAGRLFLSTALAIAAEMDADLEDKEQ